MKRFIYLFLLILLSIRINDIVNFHVSTGVRDFLDVSKIEDKDSIVKLFNNLTSATKANLSSSLLFMFSLMRGALFSLYCDNKLYLNYGIGWNNLLFHFVDNPHLIFTLDNKDIKLAEEQLEFIKNDLSKQFSIIEHKIGGEVGPLTYYFRPLNDYLNELIHAGFQIKHVEDWFIDMEHYNGYFDTDKPSKYRRTGKVPMYTFIECAR